MFSNVSEAFSSVSNAFLGASRFFVGVADLSCIFCVCFLFFYLSARFRGFPFFFACLGFLGFPMFLMVFLSFPKSGDWEPLWQGKVELGSLKVSQTS